MANPETAAIGIFKSKGDSDLPTVPLFPYQNRMHFQAVVHMIGNTISPSVHPVVDTLARKLVEILEAGPSGRCLYM
jgi:hypothetical protein